ncbi:hypothetical protein ACHAW6_000285 [Cyclotella cf. meneghiniana]
MSTENQLTVANTNKEAPSTILTVTVRKKVSKGMFCHDCLHQNSRFTLSLYRSKLEIAFRIHRTMQMVRLIDLFSKRLGNIDSVLRFFANGDRVRPQDTAEMLGLEDVDVINCVVTSVSVITIMVKGQMGQKSGLGWLETHIWFV